MKKKLNLQEVYISVDIEATGPLPGPYSMSSIGAFVAGGKTKDGEIVLFDHKDREKVFYKELVPLPDSSYIGEAIKVGKLRNFDESVNDPTGSVRFEWMKEHGEDIVTVMEAFADFANTQAKSYGARPVFMAYPASFDWTFVYWYFGFAEVKSPFGFSSVLDLKSFYVGWKNAPLTKSIKRFMDKRVFSNLPHTHFADDDAIEQGVMGMNMLKLAMSEK